MWYAVQRSIIQEKDSMKYHSPLSVIVISLAVLLVFAAVAFTAVFSIGMTSPTLILAGRIMDDLEASGSPVSISFDSIDRNLRDGVSIHGFTLGYGGKELLSLDSVTLHMGLLDILRFLAFGTGQLEIEGSGGSLSVPPIPPVSGGDGAGADAFLPPILSRYSLSLHLHDVSMDIMGSAASDDIDVSAYLDHGLKGFSAYALMPSVRFSHGGIEGEGKGLVLSSSYEDGFIVSASLDSATAEGEDFHVSATEPVMRIWQDGDGISLAASLAAAEGGYRGAPFSISSSSATYGGGAGSLAITDGCLEYEGHSLSFASAEARTGTEAMRLRIRQLLLAEDGGELVSSDLISLDYLPEGGMLYADSPLIVLSAADLFGPGSSFRLSSIAFSASLQDGPLMETTGTVSLSAPDSRMDGAASSFRISAAMEGGRLESLFAGFPSLVLPGMEEEADISLRYADGSLSFSGDYGDYLTLRGEAGNRIHLSLFASALPLSHFLPVVEEYAPVLYNYIGSTTSATGNVVIDLSRGESGMYEGPSSFAIALSDIMFTGRAFSAAAAYSGYAFPDALSVSSFSLTTDFVRASFEGSIDYSARLPEGRFVLSATESGYEFFIGELMLESNEEYSFSASIPYFSSSWLRGNVNWSDEYSIVSEAVLKSGSEYYPFDITVDFSDYTLSVYNPMLRIDGSLGESLEGHAVFNAFTLPLPDDETTACTLSGRIDLSFGFTEQQFRIAADDFRVEHIWSLPGDPDLSFSFRGTNDDLVFTDILISGAGMEPLEGRMDIDYRRPSIALSMGAARSGERLLVSVLRTDDGIFSGLLRADSFDLSRIGMEGLSGDINLTARGADPEELLFSGTFSARSRDMINDPVSLDATLSLGSREVRLTDIRCSTHSLSATSPELLYDVDAGTLAVSGVVEYTMEKPDRDYLLSASLSLDATLPAEDDIYALAAAIISGMDFDGTEVSVHVDHLDLDSGLRVGERNVSVLYSDGSFAFSGDLVSGTYSAPDSFSLSVDLDPVAVFTAESTPSSAHDAEYRFGIGKFEISIANMFIQPTIKFHAPAPAHGEIIAVRDGMNWNLFGSLGAEEVAFDVFWMPGERVILHNPYFVVWDNSIDSVIDDCTVLDTATYGRSPGRVSLSLSLSPSLSLVRWEVDIYADEGNEVGIRLPMAGSGIDLWGDVTGELQVSQEGPNLIFLGGDLRASDLTMSIGVGPLPDWYKPKKRTEADLDLLLTSNVKFIFPLVGDPILRADLAENQRLSVRMTSDGLSVSGSLDIRSGEIFYFQKNFYITEGNISFRQNAFETGFNPLINLRARMRDFDADGNPVDIYLVLRNSTLDNISPSFESSPSKPLEEIMQILGQAILPSDMYGELNYTSIVSLASASVDILSRLGIIEDSEEVTLEQSIRTSLSLDTFSLHTSIVENLLLDTLSYAASNVRNDALSPMARYLNGTTLYLGKYISPELYLEGMVHLSADPDQLETNSNTFLAEDLDLDIELSLEWDNPLAVFTFFTQPENFTVYDVLEGFGFGISKRIVW